ncbi:hypothetical protein [Microbacterium sp.]|uniref:hypothetical protein n=1 Tax=Microbacterium sp. TaxID=51671 RepID=UPI0025F4765E|nr:hypothetical protein [Microbacterium sp.]
MANPAELLWQTFEQWHSGNHQSSAQQVRGDQSLFEHRLAVRHLDAIEELLAQLKASGRRTAVYERYFPEWVRIVFHYPRSWQQQGSASIDQTARDHLATLGDMLVGMLPVADQTQFDAVTAFLDDVVAELADDKSLPDDARRYAEATIAAVRDALGNYAAVGDVLLEDVLTRFSGALLRVAARSNNRDRWVKISERFVWPFVVNQLPALPVMGLLELMS